MPDYFDARDEKTPREKKGEEIHVSESDTKDLKIIDRSDFIFSILYAILFIWGLVLTLISL